MSEGISSLGLTGLTHNVGKREAAKADLETLGKLVNMKKADELEEQQNVLMEQQYYDKIREQADMMLEGDRRLINEKSKGLQGQIRQQIKAFGGSRTKFFANGGLALIGDYTRNVVESDEVQTYKKNKVNLEKLLDIKEKGMGDLISAKDQQSLEDYNKNGFGKITYSGILNKIDIPPSDLFARGTYATATDITRFGTNFSKLIANYQIDRPDEDLSKLSPKDLEVKMIAYAQSKGYSQLGSYVDPYENQRLAAKAQAKAAAAKDTPVTVAGVTLRVFGPDTNKPVPLSQVVEAPFYNDSELETVFGTKKYSTVGEVDSSFMEKVGYVASLGGLFGLFDYDSNNTWVPAQANDLGNSYAKSFFKKENGIDSYVFEGNVAKAVDATAIKELYYADGSPVSDEDKKSLGTQDMTIVSALAGYEFNAQGKNYMYMNAVEADGTIDKNRKSSTITEPGNEEPMAKKAAYVALKTKDGKTYYQKVQMNAVGHANELANALGVAGNTLTEEVSEIKTADKAIGDNKSLVVVEREGKANYEIQNDAFNNDYFKEKVAALNPVKGTNYRANLMKAFYMTNFDVMAGKYDIGAELEKDRFTAFLASRGLEKYLVNKTVTDAQLLDLIEEELISEATSKDDIVTQKVIVAKMRNYLTKSLQQ